jgi:hypothetical protein
MLAHAPRVLPPLAAVLADIGNPSAAELAAVLDVDARTFRRWIAADKMPRVSTSPWADRESVCLDADQNHPLPGHLA